MLLALMSGKIPYYTMPPVRSQVEPSEARIVSELGKEFNINEVYSGESSFIGSLKSVDDFNPVEVPPSCPLNFDDSMQEQEVSLFFVLFTSVYLFLFLYI